MGEVREGHPVAEAGRLLGCGRRWLRAQVGALYDRPRRTLPKPVTASQTLLGDRPGSPAGSRGIFVRGCEACVGQFIHVLTDLSQTGSSILTYSNSSILSQACLLRGTTGEGGSC